MEENIEKVKLSFWVKVASSVQGMKHYENVIKETTGKAVIYLLLISLFLGVIGAVRGSVETNNGISTFIKIFNDKCPDFELKNGMLSVEGSMPMVLSEDEDAYIVLDTTNNTDPSVLDSHKTGILILRDKMIQKRNEVQTQVTDFKSLQGITINKNTVNGLLPFAKAVIPLIFLGNILGNFVGGLLSSLILAVFALIINGIYKTELKYGQLFSLSLYALTTPLMISTLFKIFGLAHFSFYWLVYHLIAFAYICYAVEKLKDSRNNLAIGQQ